MAAKLKCSSFFSAWVPSHPRSCSSFRTISQCRTLLTGNATPFDELDRVVRLSKHFVPTLRQEGSSAEQQEGFSLLIRGGYIRQSSSGIYTLLPNGLRMVKNIERIIDSEMQQIGASKIELPSLLPGASWHKSGRYGTMGAELYKVKDRRGSEFVVAPTCEEEITKLVGDDVHSWRQLPVKLYQITTKHRDEPRPRNGLLRTRAFLMKDLYSFDASIQEAESSYEQIREAYDRIMTYLFGAQGKGWIVAEADSGAMGGLRSHEYQVPHEQGEDTLYICDTCNYAANCEQAISLPTAKVDLTKASDVKVHLFGPLNQSEYGCTLTALISLKGRELNNVKLRKVLSRNSQEEISELYPSATSTHIWDWKDRPEGPMVRFDKLHVLLDYDCTTLEPEDLSQALLEAIEEFGSPPQSKQLSRLERNKNAPTLHDYFGAQFSSPEEAVPFQMVDVRQVEHNDKCAVCQKGHLQTQKAIEVGHTFLLGTRYSESLGYTFMSRPAEEASSTSFLQMGCYGIGVTRILGTLAQIASQTFSSLPRPEPRKAQRHGFAWKPAIAPFQALVLPLNPANPTQQQASRHIINHLQSENLASSPLQPFVQELQSGRSGNLVHVDNIAYDDRRDMTLGSKLAEADLVGYPLVFLLGKTFDHTGQVEVRYRSTEGYKILQLPETVFARS